jgi:hypothetical protein
MYVSQQEQRLLTLIPELATLFETEALCIFVASGKPPARL